MKQLHLFRTKRSFFRPWQSIVATLLHYANSSPPWLWRNEFFRLKDQLLRKYGTFLGTSIQEIRKPCWGPWFWTEWGYEPTKCLGEKCPRCGGTGNFDVRWVRLLKWEWCGFVFFVPAGDTRIKPEREPDIGGRIEHANYGLVSDEAALWLLILCREWKLFRRVMTSSCHRGWQEYPLLSAQQVMFRSYWFWKRRQCPCGRWFFTWDEGHRRCPKCRVNLQLQEVPF